MRSIMGISRASKASSTPDASALGLAAVVVTEDHDEANDDGGEGEGDDDDTAAVAESDDPSGTFGGRTRLTGRMWMEEPLVAAAGVEADSVDVSDATEVAAETAAPPASEENGGCCAPASTTKRRGQSHDTR
jgi:hypothetical protein